MAGVHLDSVTFTRDGTVILAGISLDVVDGEFLTIIGPSGSGKTTLLRIVAGLDTPDRGDVYFDGRPVTDQPSYKRDIAMVFQENVLIPFRSVRSNVSFPLEVHRRPQTEIDERVGAEARAMAIERFLERMPHQLGSGHQQLVQAARALVRRPTVFLLDEPLARVDAELRRGIRNEFKLVQQGYGVTAMYATNDPVEAMALGDRIAVLDRGTLIQIGSPEDVYRNPVNRFVAGFLGSPTMSFLDVRVTTHEVILAAGGLPAPPVRSAGAVAIGVRPEDWEIVTTAGLPGRVSSFVSYGDHGYATVDLAGDEIVLRTGETGPTPGEPIQVWTRRYVMFDAAGRRISTVGRPRITHV